MKLKLSTAVFTAMFGVLSFSSCLDDQFAEIDTTNLDQIVLESTKTNISDGVINEVNTLIGSFVNKSANKTGLMKAAAMVAMPEVKQLTEEGKYPAEYIVDFGDWGYTDNNGRVYTGTIHKTVFDIASSYVEFKSIEFYVDKNLIDFTRTVTYENGLLTVMAEERTKLEDGRTSEKKWELFRTLTDDGGDITAWWNNSYSIVGTTYGITIHGEKYKSVIVEPLIVSKGYRYYVRGIVETTSEKGNLTINYGDGEEDNIAYKTINDGKPVMIKIEW